MFKWDAGQDERTISHSKVHFLGTPVPICATDLSTLDAEAAIGEYILTNPETQMPANQVIQPVQQRGAKRITAQMAVDFVLSRRRSTPWDFMMATFHYQPYQEFQLTFCSLCHRRGKYTQHLRPLLFLGIYRQS